jgi:hypothetical protein
MSIPCRSEGGARSGAGVGVCLDEALWRPESKPRRKPRTDPAPTFALCLDPTGCDNNSLMLVPGLGCKIGGLFCSEGGDRVTLRATMSLGEILLVAYVAIGCSGPSTPLAGSQADNPAPLARESEQTVAATEGRPSPKSLHHGTPPQLLRYLAPEIASPKQRHGGSELTKALIRPGEDSIREFVIRDMITVGGYGGIYFLSCDHDADPSVELLGRLADLKVRIRVGSRATYVESRDIVRDSIYFDRITNEPGHRLIINKLRRIEKRRVEVEGSFCTKALEAFGNVYIFEETDTGWKVLARRRRWVS